MNFDDSFQDDLQLGEFRQVAAEFRNFEQTVTANERETLTQALAVLRSARGSFFPNRKVEPAIALIDKALKDSISTRADRLTKYFEAILSENVSKERHKNDPAILGPIGEAHQAWDSARQRGDSQDGIENLRFEFEQREKQLSSDLIIQSSLVYLSPEPTDSLVISRFIPYEIYITSDNDAELEEIHEAVRGVGRYFASSDLPTLPVVLSSRRIRGVIKTAPMGRNQLENLDRLQSQLFLQTSQPQIAGGRDATMEARRIEAEISKLLAETEKLKAEILLGSSVDAAKTRQDTLKAASESGKNIVDAVEKLINMLLKVTVAFSLLFGRTIISNPSLGRADSQVGVSQVTQRLLVNQISAEEARKALENYLAKLAEQENITKPTP